MLIVVSLHKFVEVGLYALEEYLDFLSERDVIELVSGSLIDLSVELFVCGWRSLVCVYPTSIKGDRN